jgi:hypothetical protein
MPKIKREFLLKSLRGKSATAEFKKVVTGLPEEINLKRYIRGFVRSLQGLHIKMREATAGATSMAADVWKDVRNKCKALGCGQLVIALATPLDDPHITLRYLAFMADPPKHLEELQQYNSSRRKIGDNFVTTQDEDEMLRDLSSPRP